MDIITAAACIFPDEPFNMEQSSAKFLSWGFQADIVLRVQREVLRDKEIKQNKSQAPPLGEKVLIKLPKAENMTNINVGGNLSNDEQNKIEDIINVKIKWLKDTTDASAKDLKAQKKEMEDIFQPSSPSCTRDREALPPAGRRRTMTRTSLLESSHLGPIVRTTMSPCRAPPWAQP